MLGSLLIAAKSGDIGGYTLGRLFGRRKMAPLLSPGKTWAGGSRRACRFGARRLAVAYLGAAVF